MTKDAYKTAVFVLVWEASAWRADITLRVTVDDDQELVVRRGQLTAGTTRRVVAEIQRDGTCWCGGTVWQGQAAMRISVSSWATTDEDVECSLAAMLRIAAEANHGA